MSDPYNYIEKNFTTEIYKIEVSNLPVNTYHTVSNYVLFKYLSLTIILGFYEIFTQKRNKISKSKSCVQN